MRSTLALLLLSTIFYSAAADSARPPKDDADLRFWLENMICYHRFTPEEITAATGLNAEAIAAAKLKFNLGDTRPARDANAPLRVLPYPGGRHPRIGFLEGAINPQRETKFSVFTPWSPTDYIVVDVPEAIWSNLGLTYLAHKHIDTIWTKKDISLDPLEWTRKPDGALELTRRLPNGIEFGTRIRPERDAVRMELWLKNGTPEKLTDLRVQNCIMLKAASGFAAQTADNKLFKSPFACCHDADKKRWIITAWDPPHRQWGNPKCPCFHADPKFPDCAPGETQTLRGWLSFYEGPDIDAELARIKALGWEKK